MAGIQLQTDYVTSPELNLQMRERQKMLIRLMHLFTRWCHSDIDLMAHFYSSFVSRNQFKISNIAQKMFTIFYPLFQFKLGIK